MQQFNWIHASKYHVWIPNKLHWGWHWPQDRKKRKKIKSLVFILSELISPLLWCFLKFQCWNVYIFNKLRKPSEDNKQGEGKNLDAGFLPCDARHLEVLQTAMFYAWESGNQTRTGVKIQKKKRRKNKKMREILHVDRNQHSELRRQTEWASSQQRRVHRGHLEMQTWFRLLASASPSTSPLHPPKCLCSSLLANVPVIPDCNL